MILLIFTGTLFAKKGTQVVCYPFQNKVMISAEEFVTNTQEALNSLSKDKNTIYSNTKDGNLFSAIDGFQYECKLSEDNTIKVEIIDKVFSGWQNRLRKKMKIYSQQLIKTRIDYIHKLEKYKTMPEGDISYDIQNEVIGSSIGLTQKEWKIAVEKKIYKTKQKLKKYQDKQDKYDEMKQLFEKYKNTSDDIIPLDIKEKIGYEKTQHLKLYKNNVLIADIDRFSDGTLKKGIYKITYLFGKNDYSPMSNMLIDRIFINAKFSYEYEYVDSYMYYPICIDQRQCKASISDSFKYSVPITFDKFLQKQFIRYTYWDKNKLPKYCFIHKSSYDKTKCNPNKIFLEKQTLDWWLSFYTIEKNISDMYNLILERENSK